MSRTSRRIALPDPEASVHIGCSGWQYKHWRGNFYPAAEPATRWLEYYATHFDTVEINNSFYRLPAADTFAQWRPSRSTVVRLCSKGNPLPDAYEKAQGARSARGAVLRARPKTRHHLGPVLYQLPPHWPRNLQRLETFLHTLPKNRLHAIEFRDPTWYSDETFEMLRRHKVTLCLHDMAGSSTGQHLIGPFVYLRLHGPQRYAGR